MSDISPASNTANNFSQFQLLVKKREAIAASSCEKTTEEEGGVLQSKIQKAKLTEKARLDLV